MRTIFPTTLAILLATAAATAQTGSSSQQTPSPPSLMTLSGCVSPGSSANNKFTLKDDAVGETYALSGVNAKEFAGKRVELRAVPPSSSKLKIVGGLYPTPNVAAQAGSIDPSRAAIAAQSGPTANVPRPPIEIRVRSMRTIAGDCPDPSPAR